MPKHESSMFSFRHFQSKYIFFNSSLYTILLLLVFQKYLHSSSTWWGVTWCPLGDIWELYVHLYLINIFWFCFDFKTILKHLNVYPNFGMFSLFSLYLVRQKGFISINLRLHCTIQRALIIKPHTCESKHAYNQAWHFSQTLNLQDVRINRLTGKPPKLF